MPNLTDIPTNPIDPERDFNELFSLQKLRKTWNTLRKELKSVNTRDAVGWIDWIVTINQTLPTIRDQILKGEYTPSAISQLESAKSKGSFRIISLLNIRDALIYRHISDFALEKAIPSKVKGAFFSRRHQTTPVGKTFLIDTGDSAGFWEIWLRYNEYRSRTFLSSPYACLVVTDISNYFDSIQHELLFEYLMPLGLPRKSMGVLGKLLDAFRPWAGHSPRPRVGLPVDELDCSRQLAHVFLFEHDRRVAKRFGEESYVRWVDDQNIGVKSHAEARLAVNMITRSLAQQRLTLNAGKTRFLTPKEVVIHFQLDANQALTEWEKKLKQNKNKPSAELIKEFCDIWSKIKRGKHVGKGLWNKILKRTYGYCTQLGLDLFVRRSSNDLIEYPDLAERIFIYLSMLGRGKKLVNLFRGYLNNGESLYESTEYEFFESILLLSPDFSIENQVRDLAGAFARGILKGQTGRPMGRASAILSLYWFGESANTILSLFPSEDLKSMPKEVVRNWLAVLAALDPLEYQKALPYTFGHSADDVARLIRFINDVQNGQIEKIGEYRNLKYRGLLTERYLEPRAWLVLHLASRTSNTILKKRLKDDFKRHFLPYIKTKPEKREANAIASILNVNIEPNKIKFAPTVQKIPVEIRP